MKKIYILLFILQALSLKAEVVYQQQRTYLQNNSVGRSRRYQYRPRKNYRRPNGQQRGESLDDFCRNCCAQGRSVSKECCIRCNSCQSYSDEAKSECLDFPL